MKFKVELLTHENGKSIGICATEDEKSWNTNFPWSENPEVVAMGLSAALNCLFAFIEKV